MFKIYQNSFIPNLKDITTSHQVVFWSYLIYIKNCTLKGLKNLIFKLLNMNKE